MMRKLKNCLMYSNLERKEWLLVRDFVRQENSLLLKFISAVMFLIMGVLAVYTHFFDNVYPENAVAYASIASAELVLFILTNFVAERKKGIVPILVIFFNVTMYAFGMAIGSYFDTENYALAFVIMIIVLPLLFCVPPISGTGLVVVMDVIFLFLSHDAKDHSVFEVDVMNVVIWTIVGLFLNCIFTSVRVKNHWMILKRTKSQNELQQALDTVNSQMAIFRSFGSVYAALYYVDLETNHYEELTAVPESRAYFGRSGDNASDCIQEFCEKIVVEKHRLEMRLFANLKTVSRRMKRDNIISRTFLSSIVENSKNEEEWVEFSVIAVKRNVYYDVTSILVAARTIHDEKMRELKQMERLQEALDAAESANKAKTVFLNSMSHDIRTPMNAITGFTGLAQKHIDDRPLVMDYLDKISVANQHLLSLINDVLDMSRIESGRISLSLKPESITSIVDELKTIMQDDVGSRKLDLNVDVHDVVNRFVYCDKLRLKQVLLNLLSNSVKFTQEGGRIDFLVRELESQNEKFASYEFTVRDTGIGMSPEFVSRVFLPFEREKTSTVSGIQGTGLGMSISKSLVDMMEGEISVKSQLNQGSEFVVRLDFKVASPDVVSLSDKKGKSLVVEPGMFAGKKILLVDDNNMNQLIVLHMLKDSGVKIDTAVNGLEACQILESNPSCDYDAILMDVQMPVMDGYAATRRIRSSENSRLVQIPIIAMTADVFEEDRDKAFAIGMSGHIAKPINCDLLIQVLKEFLNP